MSQDKKPRDLNPDNYEVGERPFGPRRPVGAPSGKQYKDINLPVERDRAKKLDREAQIRLMREK